MGMVSRDLLARASAKGIHILRLFPTAGDLLEMIFVIPTFTRRNIYPLYSCSRRKLGAKLFGRSVRSAQATKALAESE
jgi:hypothetical protein